MFLRNIVTLIVCAVNYRVSAQYPQKQHPLLPTAFGMSDAAPAAGDVLLSDALGRERDINIFSGLVRSVESVLTRLGDKSSNTTVLAPLNGELTKMSKKPWESEDDYARYGIGAYEGNNGEDRAQKNLRQFVEAHVVPQSPLKAGEEVQTLAGTKLWIDDSTDTKKIQPDDIAFDSVADTGYNGQIWVIQGVLSRSQ